MTGKRVMVSGYGSEDGTLDDLQNISEGIVKEDDGWLLRTSADGKAGMSGSPMLDLTNFSYSVVGIASGLNFSGKVAGPKINTTIVNLINDFNASH